MENWVEWNLGVRVCACVSCDQTTRVTGGDVDVVSRGCASECMEEESLGPFAVQSRCCNTDLCNN